MSGHKILKILKRIIFNIDLLICDCANAQLKNMRVSLILHYVKRTET